MIDARLGILVLLGIMLAVIPGGIHKVDEGHVGVYFRGGALLKGTTEPGFHLMIPLITSMEQVQVSVQTDKVKRIPCGTSGGTMITFDFIEVVNQLRKDMVYETIRNYTIEYDKTWIFDRIHHEINQFCSGHTLREVYIELFDTVDERLAEALQMSCDKWAPGISIISVRVTKPAIPDSISENFKNFEEEKAKLLIATEHQRVLEREAETQKRQAIIEAEKEAEVARIALEKMIMEKEGQKKIADIGNAMHLAKQMAEADAYFYRTSKDAEANKLKLTKEYLQLVAYESIAKNGKIFFGDSIPQMFLKGLLPEDD